MLLVVMVCAYDWQYGDVIHMINLYGFFSTIAWPTNAFLALRVMYHDRKWLRVCVCARMCVCARASICAHVCVGEWSLRKYGHCSPRTPFCSTIRRGRRSSARPMRWRV